MIEVRLFATFREGREKIIFLEHQPTMNGYYLCDLFKIDPEEVAIFLIQGQHRKLNVLIEDNKIVSMFPPVGGG